MSNKKDISQGIFTKGTLFDLDIGHWGAIKKMSADDLLLKDVNKDAIYTGHKKLLPRNATQRLAEIESQARTFLFANSIPFPIAGARFVSFKALSKVVKRLRALQTEYQESVKVLVENYPALRDRQIQVLDEQSERFSNYAISQFQQAGSLGTEEKATKIKEANTWLENQKSQHRDAYLTPEELQASYSFDWRVFKLSAIDNAELIDTDALEAFQEKYQQDLKNWATQATAVMHKTLGEAAAQARSMLERQGKMNPKNLKPLFSAFETFKNVDFTGQSNFQTVIDNFKKKFLGDDWEKTSELINATDASKEEFSKLLSVVADLAVDGAAKEAGLLSLVNSDLGRVIDLDI